MIQRLRLPRVRSRPWAAALCLTAAACGGPEPPADAPERTDDAVLRAREQALQRKGLTEVPQPVEPILGEVPARMMADVREHLAGRTGAEPDSFEVIRGERHQWPSGALGCPQPDLVYSQRPADGYWIVLRHAGRDYDYRLSDSGTLVLCEGMTLDDPPVL